MAVVKEGPSRSYAEGGRNRNEIPSVAATDSARDDKLDVLRGIGFCCIVLETLQLHGMSGQSSCFSFLSVAYIASKGFCLRYLRMQPETERRWRLRPSFTVDSQGRARRLLTMMARTLPS